MSDHYFESRDDEHPSRTVSKNEFHGVLTSQVLGVKKGDHTGLQGIMTETWKNQDFGYLVTSASGRRLSLRDPRTTDVMHSLFRSPIAIWFNAFRQETLLSLSNELKNNQKQNS